MNIYLIANKERTDQVESKLVKIGQVVSLTSENNDFSSYQEIFDDPNDKIIGIAPGIIDWKVPNKDLDEIKNLKGISTLSAWGHYIDIEYCNQHNIIVTNTPGANSQSVAEYAVWMMFCLFKRLPIQIYDNFNTISDNDHQQQEVLDKTAGIVGLGNIGTRIAKMTQGLGMNVIYWSPKSRNDKYQYRELEDLLQQTDVVFNCVETFDGTKNLFSQQRLSLLKPNSYFVSVLGGMGWGPEDNITLIDMVNQGKLAGFAIEDAHEPNFQMPTINKSSNIFIPGSYAYYTGEAEQRSLEKWIEAISGISTGNIKYQVK